MESRRRNTFARVAAGTLLWAGCSSNPSPPPAWEPGTPVAAAELGTRRGYREARGIIHLHSVHSHDACDNNPLPGGIPNEPCLQDLRHGLCVTQQDFAFLTEHIASLTDRNWEDVYLLREGDEPVMQDGTLVANRIDCGDGFHPFLAAGGEFDMMPIGMRGHAESTPEARKARYNRDDAESAGLYRERGALVMGVHTESKTLEFLRETRVEGMEIYNLHANIDPKIRPDLGLDPLGFFSDILPFLRSGAGSPHPDLVFLAFFDENRNALGKWEALLLERPVTAIAGSDAHQNAIPTEMKDGERGDSYRRVLGWFSNHVLVQSITVDEIKSALKDGRAYVAFEGLGVPVGFDLHAESEDGTTEMGSEVEFAHSPNLVIRIPQVFGLTSSLPQPEVWARLLRVIPAGHETVLDIGGPGRQVSWPVDQPGIYRIEIRIIPSHLAPALGDSRNLSEKEFVWIYSNPIYVR
ncbi:MAG: hypothetical protein HYT87_11035 [Nitrospirae bacterium]|nr:hypothetical protein [Nitrospirota bacterium]